MSEAPKVSLSFLSVEFIRDGVLVARAPGRLDGTQLPRTGEYVILPKQPPGTAHLVERVEHDLRGGGNTIRVYLRFV